MVLTIVLTMGGWWSIMGGCGHEIVLGEGGDD